MIRGQVARILSDRQLALNVGKEDGVEKGMRFAIYAPTDVITDPETGKTLGEYRHRKATVVVTTVADRFCFVGPPQRNPFLTSLLGSPSIEAEQPVPSLPVERSQIEPFPTGVAIRVGDSAELIETRSEGKDSKDASSEKSGDGD